MVIETGADAGGGFIRRFLALAGGYWCSERKWAIRLLTLSLGALTVGQVVVPIMINLWSERLFDALEQRSMHRLLVMVMLVFGIIAFSVANTFLHVRVKRKLQMGWRQWLTEHLLDEWVWRGRHHQITYMPGDHDNPDGRIAEDIRITTESAIDLGHSLSYCAMLLISFVNILWMLSGSLDLTIADHAITIPGYLLYIALLYAAAGTTIATLLGRPLVRAVNSRQGYEADFRHGLARVRENAQAIALLHAEARERSRLFDLVGGLTLGWNGQTRALSNVMLFSAVYSVLSVAFPILVGAPRYITGAITLGVLMQTAQAFQQTAAALSWPIDNLAATAGWKASVERVLGLNDALQALAREMADEDGAHIVVERSDSEEGLSFRGLTVSEPDGRPVIAAFDAEVRQGERVLIMGDPGAAIRLFRVVARVWPWGGGRVILPAHTRVFVMPQRPYLPRGSLRAAIAYPSEPETISDEAAALALERVGLARLVPRIDDSEKWKEALAVSEQQLLGFARLLIRRPDWIFVEDATDALSPEDEERMLRLLAHEFPEATLMTISSHANLEAHHNRKFVLERGNGAVHLREETCRSSPDEHFVDPVM